MVPVLELEKLQANTPADSFDDIRATIESQQGKTLEELFASFEEEPLASASIGQIHRATLHDGSEVVVKVRHKGIERTIETDLDILAGLALYRVPVNIDLDTIEWAAH